MQNLNPKDAFLAEISRLTQPVEGKKSRLLGNAFVEVVGQPDSSLKLDEDEVYLGNIEAPVRRQGDGTKAMKQIIDLADAYGVAVVLHSAPEPDSGISPYDLRQFYRSFGFKRVGDNDLMARQPASQAATPA